MNESSSTDIMPQEATQKHYCPAQIVDIFSEMLSATGIGAKVVYITGVFCKTAKQCYGGYYYETLRDQNANQEIVAMVPQSLDDVMDDGSLVCLEGTVFKKIQNRGTIQIGIKVSGVKTLQQQVVSEEDMRRSELRTLKTQKGFRNVDSILEGILMRGERPRIALVFAASSITMADFDAGKQAASASMDFWEYRVNFTSSSELCSMLRDVDASGYDLVCLIRGGGSGIEHLDDLAVIETVVGLKTPFVCAVGHVEEKIFLKNVSDKVAPTPNGLGSWLSETAEKVAKARQDSVAVITEQVRKQFQERLETQVKQNADLQEKLKALTGQNAESSRKLQEQLAEANKKNGELSETIKRQTQEHSDQMKALNATIESFKKDSAQQNSQQIQNLASIQKSNADLISKNTALNEELSRVRASLSEAQKEGHRIPVITYVVALVCVVLAIMVFAS